MLNDFVTSQNKFSLIFCLNVTCQMFNVNYKIRHVKSLIKWSHDDFYTLDKK